MARKISRKNGAAWGAAKGLWGTADGANWLPAKKAWANNGGVWTQVWPPDLTFTSFSVTAASAEPGYTTSLVSWAIDTSVPGTVTIQRKTPAGVWSDVLTGQALSGSTTLNPLIPTQGAAGTWQFRAAFIPTHDPTWIQYSALDNVTVTVPAASLTVTATSGEVYYTSSNMTWSVTGSTPGTVKLQRKNGVGGTYADFATGLAKSGSSSYQLAPAGTGQNGTWYYRAVFTPTHDAAWNILSAEDSATLTYRNHGTVPTTLRWILPDTSLFEDPYDLWFISEGWGTYLATLPIRLGATSADGFGTIDWNALSSITLTIQSNDYYAWYGSAPFTYSHYGVHGNTALSFGLTYSTGDHQGTAGARYWQASAGTWDSIAPWAAWPGWPNRVGSPTVGIGFTRVGAAQPTVTLTWPDGQTATRTVQGDFVVARNY